MAMPPSSNTLEQGPGGPSVPLNEEVPLFIVCMNAVSTVTHLLLGAVAITAFICINMVSLIATIPSLSAHVYLTVIGYVFLMSQAVLSLKPQSGWGNNFKYPQKTNVYWGLQVIGSLLAVIGGGLGIAGTEEINWSVGNIHLVSSHQVVGFIAMLCTAVSLVGGLVHLVRPHMVNTNFFKAIYACVVTLTLTLAFVAIILAIDDFRGLLFHTNTNLVISFTVFSLVGMLSMMIANFVVGGKFVI